MSESILTSTKKVLGIEEEYTAFDVDVLMHINSVFSTLTQIGLGPIGGFTIEDKTATWDAFVTDARLDSVKSYMYLRVRLLFDPPGTSFLIDSMNNQIKELEWRLSAHREYMESDPQEPEDMVLDGGTDTTT